MNYNDIEDIKEKLKNKEIINIYNDFPQKDLINLFAAFYKGDIVAFAELIILSYDSLNLIHNSIDNPKLSNFLIGYNKEEIEELRKYLYRVKNNLVNIHPNREMLRYTIWDNKSKYEALVGVFAAIKSVINEEIL